MEGHVREKGLNSNWSIRLGPTKKTPTNFFSHLLQSSWVESTFPYALSLCYKRAKWNTIGVAIRASIKLPHSTCLTPTYLMENKMQLVHHIVEWWGCICIIENNKGLNERTWGYPMMKPVSKLMKVGWEQGKILSQDDHKGLD